MCSRQLQQQDQTKKSSYRLRLAVDEIATNIIVHGYEESNLEGNITIIASIDEKCLTITLEDTGPVYDPATRPDPENLHQPMEERSIGGLGVYLAFQGVDRFTYERVGNCNRNIFVMNCPPA